MEWAENINYYKLCVDTNLVEMLHSVRRKFADKKLNFKSTYEMRSHLALLSCFLQNSDELILQQLEIVPGEYYSILQQKLQISSQYFKDRRKTSKYKISRIIQKNKKYKT